MTNVVPGPHPDERAKAGTPPVGRRDHVLLVWAGLVLATAVSWLVGTDAGSTGAIHGVALVVLTVGLLKARFIGLYFMELRTAPRLLRALFETWVLSVFVLLVVLFELSS